MNTIKTLALATIIIGMASCASIQKSQMIGAFGKSTKLTTEEDSLFKAVVLSHSNLQLKPQRFLAKLWLEQTIVMNAWITTKKG